VTQITAAAAVLLTVASLHRRGRLGDFLARGWL
jgi:hypothetical protein